VILAPFDEMNINENAWGYGNSGNTATKFVTAWKHIHDLFTGVSNVKFGLDYNNVSVPSIAGNLVTDYYPGDTYVDYVGVDGFSLSSNWQTFGELFDNVMNQINSYNKPIIVFSVASEGNPQKADWITEGLGSHIKTYKNVLGWIWFNQGGSPNWLVNSDSLSLQAFRSVLP